MSNNIYLVRYYVHLETYTTQVACLVATGLCIFLLPLILISISKKEKSIFD